MKYHIESNSKEYTDEPPRMHLTKEMVMRMVGEWLDGHAYHMRFEMPIIWDDTLVIQNPMGKVKRIHEDQQKLELPVKDEWRGKHD